MCATSLERAAPQILEDAIKSIIEKYAFLDIRPDYGRAEATLRKLRSPKEEAEVAAQVAQTNAEFEQLLGHKPYPGQLNFGMIPQEYAVGVGKKQGVSETKDVLGEAGAGDDGAADGGAGGE